MENVDIRLQILTCFLTLCLVWDLDDGLWISSVLTSIGVLYCEQLCGVPFWSSLLGVAGFSGILCFGSLAKKLWFCYLLFCTLHDCACIWGQMTGGQREESGVWSNPLWTTASLPREGKCLFLRILAPTSSYCRWPLRDHLGPGAWQDRRERRRWCLCPLSIGNSLFCSLSQY